MFVCKTTVFSTFGALYVIYCDRKLYTKYYKKNDIFEFEIYVRLKKNSTDFNSIYRKLCH